MSSRRSEEAGGQELAELAALADGTVAPERRAALEARVAASPELETLLAEQQHAIALLQGAASEVEAPAGLRRRIDARRNESRGLLSRRLVLAAGTAAAVAAAVLVFTVVNSGTTGQHYRTALAGTDLAPGAAGTATLTKTNSGWRIELDAAGLPRLEGTRFYEAWLRNADGVLVPIGTFNEGRKVTLWAAVSPKVFPTVTVTRERADGDQASSGEKVLVGTVDTRG